MIDPIIAFEFIIAHLRVATAISASCSCVAESYVPRRGHGVCTDRRGQPCGPLELAWRAEYGYGTANASDHLAVGNDATSQRLAIAAAAWAM